VLLAELEVWHSRPFTPTRRVALGHLVIPSDPPPGFGGLLLGAVVAGHLGAIDLELLPDLHRLIGEIDRGERVVQPRLRHRFQVDRHGLARSTHRLVGRGEDISFELENRGSALAQVLGAVYAAERLGPTSRHAVAAVLHKAMRWRGPIGPSLVSYLANVSGARAESLMAFADPVAWALDVLGFNPGTVKPSRRDVMTKFRSQLMSIHPDHGGDETAASKLIGDASEARRILLS
jgi:hypothetical protein